MPRAPKVAAYGTNGQVRERKNKKQNYAKEKLRNKREQASPNGVTLSQKTKPTVVIKYTGMFTRGSPMNLNFLRLLNYSYFTSYWAGSAASAVGATGEGTCGSLLGGTTFGSVEARATSTPDPGSMPSAG